MFIVAEYAALRWGKTQYVLGLKDKFCITRVKLNLLLYKTRKRAKIRNRYNQAPHLTQGTNGKVTTSQLDVTNESREVSPFPAGDHNV